MPTPEPTAEPTPSPTPRPFGADMPVIEDEPIPTPDANTQVYALPTAPPVQPGFNALLEQNPETIGFLEIADMLALPVVQRENDNEFYLSHGFEGKVDLCIDHHPTNSGYAGMTLVKPEKAACAAGFQ